MNNRIASLSGLLLVGILATSCVSKQKYDALAHEKWSAEKEIMQLRQQNQNLNGELQNRIAGFNAVRADLTANNAEKDKAISEMTAQLKAQKREVSQLKNDLDNAKNNIVLNNSSSNEQIRELQDRLRICSEDKKAVQQKYDELEVSGSNLKMQIESLNNRIEEKERQIKNEKENAAFFEKQINSFKSQISKLKQENEKFKNQVNLLKKEIGI